MRGSVWVCMTPFSAEEGCALRLMISYLCRDITFQLPLLLRPLARAAVPPRGHKAHEARARVEGAKVARQRAAAAGDDEEGKGGVLRELRGGRSLAARGGPPRGPDDG